MDNRGTGVPASIRAAWGLGEAPSRGPKRALTIERIVDAGVRLADRDGLDAVSMSRVAGELGVSTMSLYRYVAAKDELLQLMTDAAVGLPPDMGPAEDWREAVNRWAHEELERIYRHPWWVRVAFASPPLTPNHTTWMEYGLRALADTSLREQEKLSAMLLVSGFVRNWALLTLDLQESIKAAGGPENHPVTSYGARLMTLIDPQRFPAVARAIASGALDDDQEEFQSEFTFGLERILDGIEALIRARDGVTTPVLGGADRSR